MEEYLYPVTVEGNWGNNPPKTIKNKLLIYFQSRKRSGGGDCQVEVGGEGATVRFKSDDDRKRVLAQDHELTIANATVKLRALLGEEEQEEVAQGTGVDDLKPTGRGEQRAEPEEELGAGPAGSGGGSTAVLLEQVPEQLTPEMLSMMLEKICGVPREEEEEEEFSLEIIRHHSAAVVTFRHPSALRRFLAGVVGAGRFQQYGLRWRVLERSSTVRVEGLPPQANAQFLELYFQSQRHGGGQVEAVTMVPNEQAAIIAFQDPQVAESVLQRKQEICGVAVSVFPFLPELGVALYGMQRVERELPEAVGKDLHPTLAAFLRRDAQQAAIMAQLQPLLCQVEVGYSHLRLHPQPALLARPPDHITAWQGEASRALRDLVAHYRCHEFPVTAAVWGAVGEEIQRAMGESATMLLNQEDGMVAIAGRAEDMERIWREVEKMLLRAVEQQERPRDRVLEERPQDEVSQEMDLSPGRFLLLQQAGLQSTMAQTHPALSLSYNLGAGRLCLSGPSAVVYGGKSWVLEQLVGLRQRSLDLPTELVSFLSTADCEAVCGELFTAHGVSAAYDLANHGVELLGASAAALSQAERMLTDGLASRSLLAEDPAALDTPEWAEHKRSLADRYRSSVSIAEDGRGSVGVAGFREAVEGVATGLEAFLRDRAPVEEEVVLRSRAVLLFLQEHRTLEWNRCAGAEQVNVRFESRRRPRVVLAGARRQVQEVKRLFIRLRSALSTEQLIINKPGARKCFLEMESTFSRLAKDRKCVVVLQEEGEQDEEEEEVEKEDGSAAGWQVWLDSGILVVVKKADITREAVDAVVNAANEDLQHIGGLAWALLQAAGQQLQDDSNAYVHKHGRISIGDVALTAAGRLPCRYVIHAVGPKYSAPVQHQCVQQLRRAVTQSLALAEMWGCTSVALPAISSGIFGFPLPLCATTITGAVRDYCIDSRSTKMSLAKILLVNNDDKTVQAMIQAAKSAFSNIRPERWRERTPPPAAESFSAEYSSDRPSDSMEDLENQMTSHVPGAERNRQRSPLPDAEWNSPSWSSAEDSWDRPSSSRGDLETHHTKEGLTIILRKGNIQEASTEVIVNTIALSLDLSQGAVSSAILQAAGGQIQAAVLEATQGGGAAYGDVLSTPGFRLNSTILHSICPFWDGGSRNAAQMLGCIVKTCLQKAEQHRSRSLAFPAIGTGNLGFPKPLVAQVLLRELQAFSQSRPTHLRLVVLVVHPSDTRTLECFVEEFRGLARGHRGPDQPPSSQSQQGKTHSGQSQPGFFGQVSRPAPGVHSLDVGRLTLQVSSGDITWETTDIIVNSTNDTLNLKTGVSKAILEAAGADVEEECALLAQQPHTGPVVTRGGKLRCRNIVHVVVPSDPPKIHDLVLQVLQSCEDLKAGSVAFPALGTGAGNTKPSLVAETMISAVADFVRKRTKSYLTLVKIVIFQKEILPHFLRSLKKREGGGPPAVKGMISKALDKAWETVGSYFKGEESRESREEEAEPVLEEAGPVLKEEEFAPAVFALCGESVSAVGRVSDELRTRLQRELVEDEVRDPGVAHLSAEQCRELQHLQRELSVRMQLQNGGGARGGGGARRGGGPRGGGGARAKRGGGASGGGSAGAGASGRGGAWGKGGASGGGGAALVRLQGMRRDVAAAAERVRDMAREAAASQRLRGRVEWQYLHRGAFQPVDDIANLQMETAYENRQSQLRVRIGGAEYEADMANKKAYGDSGKQLTLRRVDLSSP